MIEPTEIKLDYCIELKQMWEQFNDQIKWIDSSYSVGYVRMGNINLARISFWKEDYQNITEKTTRYIGINAEGADKEGYAYYTKEDVAYELLKKTYYYGIYVTILNIATGEQIWNKLTIDFGDNAYLHKEDWTWKDDFEVNVGDLIKDANRAWGFIEAWCS